MRRGSKSDTDVVDTALLYYYNNSLKPLGNVDKGLSKVKQFKKSEFSMGLTRNFFLVENSPKPLLMFWRSIP